MHFKNSTAICFIISTSSGSFKILAWRILVLICASPLCHYPDIIMSDTCMFYCTVFFIWNKILICIVFVVLGAIRDLMKTIWVWLHLLITKCTLPDNKFNKFVSSFQFQVPMMCHSCYALCKHVPYLQKNIRKCYYNNQRRSPSNTEALNSHKRPSPTAKQLPIQNKRLNHFFQYK